MELGLKFLVAARLVVCALQFFQRRHQRLGHVAPAEFAEAACHGALCAGRHQCPPAVPSEVSAARTAAMNARTFSGSLRPISPSTPDTTSTPHGRKRAIACATFCGFSPPAK